MRQEKRKTLKVLKKALLALFTLFCALALGVPVMAEAKPTLNYEAHVENIGWQGYATEPAEAGTTGMSLQMEAIRVKSDQPLNFSYQVYVQDTGWSDPATNDAVAGTEGQGLRLEGFRASLSNGDEAAYDIRYNVYVENAGWQGWRSNGEDAGAPGQGVALEAIQISLDPKTTAEDPEPEPSELTPADMPETQPALKDDFFYGSNWDLLHQHSIDPTTGRWMNLIDFAPVVQERVASIMSGEDTIRPYDAEEAKLAELYQMILDEDSKTAAGLAPIQEELDGIMNAPDVNSLMEKVGELQYVVMTAQPHLAPLLSFYVDQNSNNSKNYSLFLTEGNLILNASALNSEDNQIYWDALRTYVHDMSVVTGYNEEKAQATADQVLGLITTLSPSVATDDVTPQSMIPNSIDFYKEIFTNFDFTSFVQKAGYDPSREIILPSQKSVEYCRQLNSVLTEENLPALKECVRMAYLSQMVNYLPAAERNVVLEINQTIKGGSELPSVEDSAFSGVKALYTSQLDKAYADRYLTPEDKENIIQMIELIKTEYRDIINNQDWMEEQTRENAIKKLDNLGVFALYPDDWTPFLRPVDVVSKEEGGTALGNALTGMKSLHQWKLNKYYEMRDNVDRDYVINNIDTLEANAYYNPPTNSIYVLAGLCGGALYDKDYSFSRNLGGVGMVIGHEISHAFDSLGSDYDSDGNFNNWWTQKDREEYAKRAADIVEYYSGYTLLGRHLDGQKTLGENIADLGGVRACLNTLNRQGINPEEFLTSFSNAFAALYTESAMLYQLNIDTHSPNKYRVNAVLSSCPEFYEAFNVQPGDGMYVAPENRVGIWR